MNAQSDINQMVAITYTLLLVFGVGGFAYVIWSFSRSKLLLRRWAEKNKFQILQSTLKPFSKGIFKFFGGLQTEYYVRIRDQEGQEHSGWLRYEGGFWTAIFKLPEIRWEPES
ncbi:MAG: hypothetical protein ABSD77_07080 [Verrucomicrobiota bacterium]|jgi:hypothetical protein